MCESKVHACVNPSRSALRVNSITRQAGGSGWKVTPKSMLFSLVLSDTRDGGLGARGKVDAAGYIALPAAKTGPTGEQLLEAEPDWVGDTYPLHDREGVIAPSRAASLTAMSLNPSCANLAPFSRQVFSFLFRWRLLRVRRPVDSLERKPVQCLYRQLQILLRRVLFSGVAEALEALYEEHHRRHRPRHLPPPLPSRSPPSPSPACRRARRRPGRAVPATPRTTR